MGFVLLLPLWIQVGLEKGIAMDFISRVSLVQHFLNIFMSLSFGVKSREQFRNLSFGMELAEQSSLVVQLSILFYCRGKCLSMIPFDICCMIHILGCKNSARLPLNSS